MQAIIFDIDQTLFKTDRLLHDGVAELLFILKQLGVQVGGVSDSDHRVIVRMEEAGIRHFFSSILCSAHVEDPKRNLQRVLAELGAEPTHTALASRLHADIAHGKQAGLAKTIVVTHGSPFALAQRSAEPTHVVGGIPAILDVLE